MAEVLFGNIGLVIGGAIGLLIIRFVIEPLRNRGRR